MPAAPTERRELRFKAFVCHHGALRSGTTGTMDRLARVLNLLNYSGHVNSTHPPDPSTPTPYSNNQEGSGSGTDSRVNGFSGPTPLRTAELASSSAKL